ncbi:hypothetical protein Tco_0194541 [Tanacetum coccineum]
MLPTPFHQDHSSSSKGALHVAFDLLRDALSAIFGLSEIKGITSITVNGKNAYELKGKFLNDLHKNTFSGTHGEDAVKHIEYFLKIVDPVNLPNVNQDKLRVVVFPISLAVDAWRWSLHCVKHAPLPRFRMDNYKIAYHDQEEIEYENGHEDKERCELFDDHELTVCNIRRFGMIKYSFGDNKECLVVKENEYDDLTCTSKDACRAYQEIFHMMEEGWMVTRNK